MIYLTGKSITGIFDIRYINYIINIPNIDIIDVPILNTKYISLSDGKFFIGI